MERQPVVSFRNVTKRFPGVVALADVSFDVAAGACHALVGENGAGKSTLGKVLAGIHAPDGGAVILNGRAVRFGGPRDALNAGVGMVHQELAFCENLSVAENLCLERLPRRGVFLKPAAMRARATEMLQAIGAEVDVRRVAGELTVGQLQVVQIAAVIGSGARVVVFDEPTSSLSQHEVQALFALIRRLQGQGVTSIYVSHRMEEIYDLCDTVTVLRDGRHVATGPLGELPRGRLVQMMIGRPLEEYFPSHLDAPPGAELLRVEDLRSPGRFEDIGFSLRAGEVLGLAGLVGAGRTELAQALFGLDRAATGRVFLKGAPVRIERPRDALRLGLGLVPEDRKRHGLVLSLGARANLTLPFLERFCTLGWVRQKEELAEAGEYFARLRVRAPNLDFLAAGLSGGNQQKVILARWLAARCQVLLLDEPTRGVDVGAKAEIHQLIEGLARDGKGVLLISSELPEVISLSTRILVLRHGRLAGVVSRAEATQEHLLRLMAGLAA